MYAGIFTGHCKRRVDLEDSEEIREGMGAGRILLPCLRLDWEEGRGQATCISDLWGIILVF